MFEFFNNLTPYQQECSGRYTGVYSIYPLLDFFVNAFTQTFLFDTRVNDRLPTYTFIID